jgi:Arc/MetJ family transcription regulator
LYKKYAYKSISEYVKKTLDNPYKSMLLYDQEVCMRTTLELPDALVNEAMSVTDIPTKTELIKFALENIIQREKIKQLADYFGRINLDIDLNKLRKR